MFFYSTTTSPTRETDVIKYADRPFTLGPFLDRTNDTISTVRTRERLARQCPYRDRLIKEPYRDANAVESHYRQTPAPSLHRSRVRARPVKPGESVHESAGLAIANRR